jgi:hypothetical protein
MDKNSWVGRDVMKWVNGNKGHDGGLTGMRQELRIYSDESQ